MRDQQPLCNRLPALRRPVVTTPALRRLASARLAGYLPAPRRLASARAPVARDAHARAHSVDAPVEM